MNQVNNLKESKPLYLNNVPETTDKQSIYNKRYYDKNKEKILAKKSKQQDRLADLIRILSDKEKISLTKLRKYFKEAGLR